MRIKAGQEGGERCVVRDHGNHHFLPIISLSLVLYNFFEGGCSLCIFYVRVPFTLKS
jgi:hypothetical protein